MNQHRKPKKQQSGRSYYVTNVQYAAGDVIGKASSVTSRRCGILRMYRSTRWSERLRLIRRRTAATPVAVRTFRVLFVVTQDSRDVITRLQRNLHLVHDLRMLVQQLLQLLLPVLSFLLQQQLHATWRHQCSQVRAWKRRTYMQLDDLFDGVATAQNATADRHFATERSVFSH